MKKTLLIFLSLVFASLLLIVSCDNSSDAPSSEVVIPSLPEGSPSISTDDLTEITKKPEEASDSDILLLDTVLGELQDFAIVETDGGKGSDLSKEAWAIVYDFFDAFGKQGIELKGDGYSLAFNADIKSTEFTVSGSFDNFKFGKVTVNGKVNSTITVNEESNPYSGDSLPFIVVPGKEKTDITVNEKNYKSLGDAMNAVMEILETEDSKSLIDDVNKAIPGLIDAVNGFIADYSVSSDMLTVALNGKITNGGLKLGKKEVSLGEGLIIALNTTAYTNKPLEYNGSEYKFFVYDTGTMKIMNNPNYNIIDEYNDTYYGEPEFNAIIEDTLNVILETSGKIGNQKIRLQAKFSGDILDKDALEVDVLVDLNGKVLDLSALQE
ncbi:MAG: hypothetical protein ACI4NI_03580 [Candidatus Ornithospirochaeta sp.]